MTGFVQLGDSYILNLDAVRMVRANRDAAEKIESIDVFFKGLGEQDAIRFLPQETTDLSKIWEQIRGATTAQPSP